MYSAPMSGIHLPRSAERPPGGSKRQEPPRMQRYLPWAGPFGSRADAAVSGLETEAVETEAGKFVASSQTAWRRRRENLLQVPRLRSLQQVNPAPYSGSVLGSVL